MRIVPVLLLVSAVGCGAEPTKNSSGGGAAPVAEPQVNGMTFADEASLPECDDAKQGFLVFVNAEKTLMTCDKGAWAKLDFKGDQGDKGDVGAKGESGATATLSEALALYSEYKRSIFRITLDCSGATGANGCPAGNTGKYLGSGFLCAEKTVCTNGHVVNCSPCFTTTVKLAVEALDGEFDTLNHDGTPSAPIAEYTNVSAFRYLATPTHNDLAKFDLPTVPTDRKPLPLATAPSSQTVTAMRETLSMSFPLGLQDLYVDIGAINTPVIGECNTQGGSSGYGCPKNFYDFGTTNDTDHGSSGSPLFDLKTGKVIGVTSAGTDNENANYTWAIDAYRFKDVP